MNRIGLRRGHFILVGIIGLLSHFALGNPTFLPLIGLLAVQKQPIKLVYATSTQTILAGLCSGVTTVQRMSGGTPLTSGSLTVNISGPGGVTFYSDNSCLSSISSVTILNGDSTADFYFLDASAGSPVLTVAATSYVSGTQTETISTNGYVWTGGGADANWNTSLNWSGGSAPHSVTTIALFDGTCSSNCSPHITASLSDTTVGGVRIASGYTGTITQMSGIAMGIGAAGWVQAAGTFVGGDTAIAVDGPFVLSGGSFTSTSDTFYAPLSWTVLNSPTFNHHSGNLQFTFPSSDSPTITPGTVSYNDVSWIGYTGGGNYVTINGNMTIAGDLTFTPPRYWMTFGGGTFSVAGDLTANGGISGSTSMKLTGNPSGQSVTGWLPNLTIDAGANNVTMTGTVGVGPNYTYISGNLITAGSSLYLNCYGGCTEVVGNATYNNVEIAAEGDNVDLSGGTMTLTGDLTLIAQRYWLTLGDGTINVGGNVIANSGAIYGDVIVRLTGNVAGQTISASAGSGITIPNLTLATGANPATVLNTNVNSGAVISTSGNLLMSGYEFDTNTLTLGGATVTKGGGVLTVGGVVIGTGALYGGTVN